MPATKQKFKRNGLLLVLTLLMLLLLSLPALFSGKLLPGPVVNYYGRIVTEMELETEIGHLNCAEIPAQAVERIYRRISMQPVLMCFDSLYEAGEWLRLTNAR